MIQKKINFQGNRFINTVQKNNCFLSVVICSYNSEAFIENCLQSLLCQEQVSKPFKIIFIDDASTDKSVSLVQDYSRLLPNLTILSNKINRGLVYSCNRVLEKIDTPYFMRLDADDYLSTDAMKKILKELNSSKKKNFVVFGRWDVCNGRLKEIELSNDIYTWISAGIVFSAEAVKAVGKYSNEYWEEYDLYIKLLEAGYKYKISHYRIYYYRRHRQAMTSNYNDKREGYESLCKKWGINILKKYGDLQYMMQYYKL